MNGGNIMAIKATDMDEFTETDRHEADELESIIDSVLTANRSNLKKQSKISFTVNNDCNAPNGVVQQEVERRYKEAGWESVKFHHKYIKAYDDYWCLSVTLTRKV